jgi:type IV secretory pathway VirB4 component
LVPKLDSFRGNNVNSNLNGHTNLELDSDIVVFDMSSFADTGQTPLFLHVMLNWAYEQAKQSDRRTDVTFEEAHYLLRHDGARDLLNLFIRHARHFDSGLTLISQTIDEFLKTEERMEIYDNCDIKQMFYMENVSERVREYFSLSEDEARFLRRAAQGENTNYSECLLSTSDHGRRRLEVSPSPFTRHICDSDADPWLWLAQNDRLRPADVDELVNEDPDTVLSVDQARQLARPGAGPPAETVPGGPIAGNQEG